jgi:hypothetical protein
MIKEKQYFGTIMFPETEVSLENICLTVSDSKFFFQLPSSYISKESWGVIWGNFNGLGLVSLLDVYVSGSENGNGGSYTKLDISTIITDRYLNSYSEVFCTEVSFFSNAFNKWIFEKHNVDFTNNENIKIPAQIEVFNVKTVNKEIKITLNHLRSFSSKHFNIERHCLFYVKFDVAISISELYLFIDKIEKFTLFITNDNPIIEKLTINKQNSFYRIEKPLNQNKFSSVPRHKYDLFKPYIDSILKNWFDDKKIEPITDLILEKYLNTDLFWSRWFLNLAVGIESFHKNFIKTKIDKTSESKIINREKIKVLLKDDSDLLKWFKNETSYWEKPELIDRLKDEKIVCILNDLIYNIIPIPIEEVLIKIKKTRNNLAHQGLHLKEFNDDLEFMIYTKIIEYLLRLLILEHLGVDIRAERNNLINESNRLLYLFAEGNNYPCLKK